MYPAHSGPDTPWMLENLPGPPYPPKSTNTVAQIPRTPSHSISLVDPPPIPQQHFQFLIFSGPDSMHPKLKFEMNFDGVILKMCIQYLTISGPLLFLTQKIIWK